MVQFIRLRGEFFGLGFGLYCSGRTDGRTASQLPVALREAARMVPDCAQPIILAYGTCELSKNFPPFGRRVAVTHIAQNQSRPIALTPL
jgi:hypothetical protein